MKCDSILIGTALCLAITTSSGNVNEVTKESAIVGDSFEASPSVAQRFASNHDSRFRRALPTSGVPRRTSPAASETTSSTSSIAPDSGVSGTGEEVTGRESLNRAQKPVSAKNGRTTGSSGSGSRKAEPDAECPEAMGQQSGGVQGKITGTSPTSKGRTKSRFKKKGVPKHCIGTGSSETSSSDIDDHRGAGENATTLLGSHEEKTQIGINNALSNQDKVIESQDKLAPKIGPSEVDERALDMGDDDRIGDL